MTKLLPAYLIVGEDQLKSETAVSRLKGHLDEGLATFNLDELAASPDLDPTALAISLNTVPVGPGFRLVIVHDANKLAKPVSETIVSYLENPNPGCVLCLVATSLPKNTRLYKAVERMGKNSIISCVPIAAKDLPGYVVRHARAKGVIMDHAAAVELVDRVGGNTTLLDRQISTLGALCQGRPVHVSDIEEHVVRTAEVKPWTFVDKVMLGDARRAIELYRHMRNPSQIFLLSQLVRALREVICARALMDRGVRNMSEIASELGKQRWMVETNARAARRFTMDQLIGCMGACADCERDLKSGADPETTFLRLVFSIARSDIGHAPKSAGIAFRDRG